MGRSVRIWPQWTSFNHNSYSPYCLAGERNIEKVTLLFGGSVPAISPSSEGSLLGEAVGLRPTKSEFAKANDLPAIAYSISFERQMLQQYH